MNIHTMKKTEFNNNKQLLRIVVLLAVVASINIPVFAATPSPWKTVYKDSFDYSKQAPKTTKFNTWFWREDSAATHQFEITSPKGCTKNKPCVALTAQAYPANTDYTNAEMYNNSCIKNPKAGKRSQKLATLKRSTWGTPLYNRITNICDIAYPYQKSDSYLTPFGLTSSWSSETLSHLDVNPLALTSDNVEAPWKAIRDINFNNPYLASKFEAIRISTKIKAETKDQGGSRGWGFWNTSLDPKFLQLAWFMEYSVPTIYIKKGSG